jgi:CheY-like chemotaxis protein
MNETLRILYLEDDWNDVELAGSTLSNSGLVFEIDHVREREGYIHVLEEKVFDVIPIDFKLPSFDGLSLSGEGIRGIRTQKI